MRKKLTYTEQLKHDYWKSKKAKILKRDNHKCVKCGKEKYLQVHHTMYIAGRKAWEYPDDFLITVCRGCHIKEHKSPIHVMKDWKSEKEPTKKQLKPVVTRFTKNKNPEITICKDKAKIPDYEESSSVKHHFKKRFDKF